MGGSPHSAGGLDAANAGAASGADRPVGLVAEQCAAAGWVYGYYDDKWQTPLTLLPVRVTDVDGGVIDEGGRTMGLATFGLEDGQVIDPVRPQLGTHIYHAQQDGRVIVTIGPDPGGPDPATLEAQILAELESFARLMENQLQPWIHEFENEGWWGVIGGLFSSAGDGLSAWWEGEGEFWATVWNWLSTLPELAGDVFEGARSGLGALWEHRGEILQALEFLASGSVTLFQDALELLLEILQSIPGIEEIVDLLRAVVQHSAEWVSAMAELTRTQVLKALGGTLLGTLLMVPPNFWAHIVGTGLGYLLPEIFITIIFAIIAAFSAGVGGGLLAGRLTAFVGRLVTKLNDLGELGVIIIQIFAFLGRITSKITDLIRALRRRIQETRPGATGEATPVVRQANPNSNPATRLPRTNGRWEGEPGNGTWYPDNEDARGVTGNRGVEFRNGRPDFSPWSRGEMEFEPGVLNGTDSDFTRVYEQLREQRGLPSNNAARQLLRDAGLTPHHHSDTVIQLIPSNLHNNVPHIGSASDLRNNF